MVPSSSSSIRPSGGHHGRGGGGGGIPERFKEKLEDRVQSEYGCFDDKVIDLDAICGPIKSLDLARRTARWKSFTVDQRTQRFKKLFVPKLAKTGIMYQKDAIIETFAHITAPLKGKYGWPLGDYPENKYNYYEMDHRREVDYSVDELDLKWLQIMNKRQQIKGDPFFSVRMLEIWFDKMEKGCLWEPTHFDKILDEEGNQIDDPCNVCLDGESNNCNRIVYCDRCNVAFHQDCYGVPFIPDGVLECRRCAFSPAGKVHCVLCPSTTGAFKQMDNKEWVHVVCVVWVDETHFGNTIFMENVQNVTKALHDRRKLSCMLCVNRKMAKMGACIQCSEGKCTASFHVTCARNHGLTMRITEGSDGEVNRFVWCPKHQPPQTEADRKMQQMKDINLKIEQERKLIKISMPVLTQELVNRIQSECTVVDYLQLVYFWFQKRKERFGTPLLKLFTDSDGSPLNSPIKKRISMNTMMTSSDALKKQFDGYQNLMRIADLVVTREQKKEHLIKMSLQMLHKAFKPIQTVIMELLESFKRIDKLNVFAEPVIGVHGYTDIIKNPISLRDMNQKAEAGSYASISLLRADVDLMIENCLLFNKGNQVYIKYGKTFRKSSNPILDQAEKEETERMNLLGNPEFKSLFMDDFGGEMMTSSSSIPSSSGSSGRGRGHHHPKKEEEEDVEVIQVDPLLRATLEEIPSESTNPSDSTIPSGRRSRKRGFQEIPPLPPMDPETPKSTDPPYKIRARGISTPVAPVIRKNPKSSQKTPESGFKKPGGPSTPSSSSTSQPPLRQTTLTSFFGGAAKQAAEKTVQGASGSAMTSLDKNVPAPSSTSIFQKPTQSTQELFKSVQPSTASIPSSSSSTNSHRTRSKTVMTPTVPTVGPTGSTVTRRTTFRVSSAAIQSPLTVPTRRRTNGMESMEEEDEDEEIVIQGSGIHGGGHLSPQELLKSAENEAKSKFAHNQLVIVDGKAAKVIESQKAHLSSQMHNEQRLSMHKRRREVLSEIPQSDLIYVEFFHKPNSMDPYAWVAVDTVELLDLDNIPAKFAKMPGLKQAKEWHQKVISGEIQ